MMPLRQRVLQALDTMPARGSTRRSFSPLRAAPESTRVVDGDLVRAVLPPRPVHLLLLRVSGR